MVARAKVPYPVSAFGGVGYTRREWREVPAGVSQKHLYDYANVLEYHADKIAEVDQLVATLESVLTVKPNQPSTRRKREK